MITLPATDGRSSATPLQISASVSLLVLGLVGHLYAAHAIGGSSVAYSHHVFGFFLILAVTGAIIFVLGRFFWRSRPAVTMLAIAFVQAIFGLLVAWDPIRAASGG